MGRAFEVRKASMLKTGAAKAKIYVRYSKEIYLAAKNGGSDPESNLNLKRLITKAQKDQVPADTIKRAIAKANSGVGEDYKPKRYEGFGPNGATLVIDCLTDNDNRTISEVKNCFTKTDNKIGIPGSVMHGFDHIGILSISGDNSDQILNIMIESDIDLKDLESEDNIITIQTQVDDFMKARSELLKHTDGKELLEDDLIFLPTSQIKLEKSEDIANFEKLIHMLNDCDDVQNIYHNVENF